MSRKVKVLIVTESDDFAGRCVRELQNSGYGTSWRKVDTPDAFTAVLEIDRWDLAVADGSCRGLCLMTLIRQRSGRAVPFIVVSPDGDDGLAVEFLEAGASNVLDLAHMRRLGAITARELDIVFRTKDWYRAMDELQAAALAVESERKEVEARLRYLGTHDILTGLHNRAYFDEELERLQKGRQFPLTILMADVDRLKEVNDTLGHAKGDELLKEAAMVLKMAFRSEDLVARVGGDEFAALLPLTNAHAAAQAMSRIRKGMAQYNRDSHQFPLSLSLGMATAREGDLLIEVLKAADREMYRDKLLNRSRRSLETSTPVEKAPVEHHA